jgi:serine/threonine-protein kinase HipA
MAVRGNTNHYLIEKIHRRHWLAQAQHVGLGAASAERLIEEIVAGVDVVIDKVSQQLPAAFPPDVAETILSGVRNQAARLVE